MEHFKYPRKRPDNCYCVYAHKNPESGTIRYIGMGEPSRPYEIRFRADRHKYWVYYLFSKGYTLQDIVQILDSGLTRDQALHKERLILVEYPKFKKKHLFNKDFPSPPNKKVTKPPKSHRERWEKRCF